MSELVYSAPEERQSRLARIKDFLEKMGPGVVQAAEINSGVTPDELKPHLNGAQAAVPTERPAAPAAQPELSRDQQVIVDEAENPLLPKE